MIPANRPEESASAFRDFIEHELRTDDLNVPDITALVPQSVIDAAWQRFLQRLAQQTQALAADPQLDLWEEALSDEHRAVVDALERAFPPLADVTALSDFHSGEWVYWLRYIAVLTLHIEANRSQVLEAADIIPFLDDSLDDEEEEPADALLERLIIRRIPAPVAPRRSGRFGWYDLALAFLLSGLFWILVSELLPRTGS